jgi:AP-3 complex subunit mu
MKNYHIIIIIIIKLQVENVTLEIPMPKIVLNCTLIPNQGKYSFDPVSKILLWDIGRIDVSKLPNLRGSVR